MKSKIKTYNTKEFQKEYLNASPELNKLFEKSIEDFFCLRIEDLIERVYKPITPSKEESHTLIFVTEGSYKTKIGFKEFTITSDNIVVLQAGVVFSTEHLSKNVKGYTCHFHPNLLIGKFGNRPLNLEFEFLNISSYPIIEVPNNAKSTILNLLQRLTTEFRSEGKPNPDIVHAYVYTLLIELKELYGSNSLVGKSAAYQITNQLRKLAHEKVKENLKASDFAKMMNISPNHLNKSVKTITAKSASHLIDEVKLIEIKYLLYHSNFSISEISYEMGYADPSYFTRFFKKREGVSPVEFRQLIEMS